MTECPHASLQMNYLPPLNGKSSLFRPRESKRNRVRKWVGGWKDEGPGMLLCLPRQHTPLCWLCSLMLRSSSSDKIEGGSGISQERSVRDAEDSESTSSTR